MNGRRRVKIPVTDEIIAALTRLFDANREPSHSTIDRHMNACGLSEGDPRRPTVPVGKAKRVRALLSWAINSNPDGGSEFIGLLVSEIVGCGGFRPDSPNYVGDNEIEDLGSALRREGFYLSSDGHLGPLLLDNLSGVKLTEALQAYVRRAKEGSHDAALLTGTSKDLLEATAAHVVVETFGTYRKTDNFPDLLAQAFTATRLSIPNNKPPSTPQERLERAIFEVGCAINNLRNREGTGHGRPWLSTVSDAEARLAVELMGAIAERLLKALSEHT